MYNQLRNAENLYWETDGAINDDDLNEQVIEAYSEVTGLLNDLQPIVAKLKQEEGIYS